MTQFIPASTWSTTATRTSSSTILSSTRRGSGRIRLKFQARPLSLSAEGDLVVEEGGVRLVQKRPSFYQQAPDSPLRRQVSGRYKLLASNVVAVVVGLMTGLSRSPSIP